MFDGSGGGDVRVEARRGGERMGGHLPIVWGDGWHDEKINKIKYIVALDGRQGMIYNTTTNQKHVGTIKETIERRCDHGGDAGVCKSIVLGVIVVHKM
jgi:hypothetical protein